MLQFNMKCVEYIKSKYHHQSVLPKGRSFIANPGTKVAALSKGRPSTANSGTKVAVLLGINRCGSFPLLSAPTLSLASDQTLKDLKRSQEPQLGGEESGFDYLGPPDFTEIHHRVNNISSIRVFDQMRDPEIPITLHP